MGSWADWRVIEPAALVESEQRLFFDQHQWHTIEAATARIIPTDHDPGAREANVVRFIDGYLFGVDYIFAAADGSGFLELRGKELDAWVERIELLRQVYREGINALDGIARERFRADFAEFNNEQQDAVLEEVSGAPKPEPLKRGTHDRVHMTLRPASDQGLAFFDALVLHTRQGFYGDPVYGGNRNWVGWSAIGFRGPRSLQMTRDCSYIADGSHGMDRRWSDLIPHLRHP